MLSTKEATAILHTVADGPGYNSAILRKLDEVVGMMEIAKEREVEDDSSAAS